jgi:Cft2 family RNA processing exonuclease
MFHFDTCLRITAAHLAIDARTGQQMGFVSHAHADHMAPHALTLCTPATARLLRHRFGNRRRVQELSYGEPCIVANHRLTAFPAGHMLGSAMLLVEYDGQSMLYTGDFRLRRSATAEPAELPRADLLVMESTYGDPRHRFPPREHVVADLVHTITCTLKAGRIPVIEAYVTGKAQELARLLWDAGIPTQQHPAMASISRLYLASGCDPGPIHVYDGRHLPGHVILQPPSGQRRARRLPLPGGCMKIAVTGWAIDPRYRFRHGLDYAFPLTDHADYDELLECIQRVQPRKIYCTHGPAGFAERLRAMGRDAQPLQDVP